MLYKEYYRKSSGGKIYLFAGLMGPGAKKERIGGKPPFVN
jgi:hypothetical protein